MEALPTGFSLSALAENHDMIHEFRCLTLHANQTSATSSLRRSGRPALLAPAIFAGELRMSASEEGGKAASKIQKQRDLWLNFAAFAELLLLNLHSLLAPNQRGGEERGKG